MRDYAIQSRNFSSDHYPKSTHAVQIASSLKQQMTIILFSRILIYISLAYIQGTYIIPTIFIKVDAVIIAIMQNVKRSHFLRFYKNVVLLRKYGTFTSRRKTRQERLHVTFIKLK